MFEQLCGLSFSLPLSSPFSSFFHPVQQGSTPSPHLHQHLPPRPHLIFSLVTASGPQWA